MTDILQKRFLSLDVLRGMTICFMIIVNTGAHLSNGLPFFLPSFIVSF
ncbi:hypothetical protein BXY57_0619 [Thermoflavifilum aggregans]|uniref:Heparan-alpha-glucosaminide N-acetyltransferase catalytic domain-containing protein n=1 Tax=Thermoflavifilum aggregans TaxID=454188 RepID=A0A2M9CT54_9BACT|nr:hypothetical protein [Thermoflavifilum aggregans]MBX6379285.1 hypothetical protein [Thermoflavifilum aggregans]PJJ75051.1 hypothetical protein BXY57_0619 [Thermoflavifilum aggregans]